MYVLAEFWAAHLKLIKRYKKAMIRKRRNQKKVKLQGRNNKLGHLRLLKKCFRRIHGYENQSHIAQGNRLSKCMIRAASLENRIFAHVKTKAQISFAVTEKLISALFSLNG